MERVQTTPFSMAASLIYSPDNGLFYICTNPFIIYIYRIPGKTIVPASDIKCPTLPVSVVIIVMPYFPVVQSYQPDICIMRGIPTMIGSNTEPDCFLQPVQMERLISMIQILMTVQLVKFKIADFFI